MLAWIAKPWTDREDAIRCAPPGGVRRSRSNLIDMPELTSYERRFRRAGLPLFIEEYSATEDVFTRATPLLALVFIGEMLGAIDLDWSLLANLGAALGGLALLLAAFALLNRVRGRPALALPDHVRIPELTAFVVFPAALPLIFGGQLTSSIVTAVVNLAVLGLLYAIIGYGLVFVVAWAGERMFDQLTASLVLLSKAIPLLLIFALVLFVNTEMWQVFSSMPREFLGLVGGGFLALGSLFLAARLPREVAQLERSVGAGPELDRRQRLNVGIVLFVSQALQVLVVSLAVGAAFVAFGALAIGPGVRESWIETAGNVLVTLDLFGEPIQVTEELLRVSGGIASFSGLYYAIAVLTDSTYREEFLDELTAEMGETFRARAEYLEARGGA